MQFDFAGKTFRTEFWAPPDGSVGSVVGFDCETCVATKDAVPPFVLGTAYGGGETVWLIQLVHLKAFFEANPDAIWIAHNAPFDISVVEHDTGLSLDSHIRSQSFFDTGILYILWKLAVVGKTPHRWSLDLVAHELLGVQLQKNDCIRLDYGRFRRDGVVYYDEITSEHIQYAAIDAVATFLIYEKLRAKINVLESDTDLSHKIQLMGAYALHHVQMRGIRFDLERRATFVDAVDNDIRGAISELARYDYFPKSPWIDCDSSAVREERVGINKQFEAAIAKAGISLPRTRTGKISGKAEHLVEYRSHHPFVNAYLKYVEGKSLRNFVAKLDAPRIHTYFRSILNTGRTSSSNPNLQNLPKKRGVRECFLPKAGYVFLIIDYSQLELVALAQICLDRYGSSKMAELINHGADLHTQTAAVITGKIESNVTAVERGKAKAVNFGFPGGLGAQTFVQYARATFGISDITTDMAKIFKEKWLEAFPEMRLYLADSLERRLDISGLSWCTDKGMAVGIFKRIISGKTFSSAGKPYSPQTVDWVFRDALLQLAPELVGTTSGSPDLLQRISKESVTTSTGRVRAKATYCQVRNTPFQGLAADGAKVALYRLVRSGFQVVNFVHDEFIIEIPVDSDYESTGNEIKDICVNAMRALIPDVKVNAEWVVADRWYKNAELRRDDQGKVIAYSES